MIEFAEKWKNLDEKEKRRYEKKKEIAFTKYEKYISEFNTKYKIPARSSGYSLF